MKPRDQVLLRSSAGSAAPSRGKTWLRIAALVVIMALVGAKDALASGGSYATAGTGTYAQSLWWLDFAGYNNAAAAGGGQAYGFTLPNGAGTLATTVTLSGNGTLAAVAEPAWSGGGAFGHGAYNGLTGSPIFYWLNQPGSPGTVALTALSVKDAAGNARSFSFHAADGENTNVPETIVYTTTSTWKLSDTVNYYANFNGAVPALAGTGTATVTETGSPTNDNSYNASIVLGTANPTQVSFALSNNEGVVVALSLPTVSLNVSVIGRVSTTDQFSGAIGYTSPVASLKTATTSGTAATATSGTVSVIGTNSITLAASLAAGSASALAYYTSSILCSNSGPGAASFGGTNTVLPSGAGTSFALTPQTGDSITCTLTFTPLTQVLSGTVYGDTNHDATVDASETGTGIFGLYVKIAAYSGGVCQNPATSAAMVTAATGGYSFPAVTAGSYCLTVTNNSTLSNTTAYLPAGWIGTEAVSGVRQVTTSASPSPPQNFGLYNGSEVSLLVFGDTGANGGTANDGVQNGGEPGINNVTVTASIGAAAVASAITGSSGTAVLWLPVSLSGTVTLTPTAPAGDLATGGSAGTTMGTYARPSVRFTVGTGNTYTGVSFGLVPPNARAPLGAQTAQAGTAVFYPHAFMAGSAGQVTFSAAALPSPAVAGWTQVLYLDSTCSGQFAGSDVAISGAIAAVANQQICILVEEFVPSGAPPNAQNKVTVSAGFAYSGSAAPPTTVIAVTDTTTVVTAGATQFIKRVQNVTLSGAYGTMNSALPGNTLQYQLAVTNEGSAPLSSVVVNDATPAFTTFVSAACPATLPTGLTGCSVSIKPAAGAQGALQWTFTGVLAPGAQSLVSYQVMVAQ
jgi:uncharacterized repeat protein (TIGR01451 family)